MPEAQLTLREGSRTHHRVGAEVGGAAEADGEISVASIMLGPRPLVLEPGELRKASRRGGSGHRSVSTAQTCLGELECEAQ